MSSVLITGAAGFLGRRLLKELIAEGHIGGKPIRRIVLADVHPAACSVSTEIDVSVRQGDLSDRGFVKSLSAEGFDTLFHMASLLTLQAETDPSFAYKVNVEALRTLMELAQNRPTVIFTSSIAIHGGVLPEEVDDDCNPVPATTYGTHKAINELLIADYSRLGRIDGRSLRLPIVLTRPGAPAPAVSDQVAAIVREPLKGMDVDVLLSPETLVPIVSAGAVVRALLRLHDVSSDRLPPKRALNLPALSVTVAELTEAAARHGGLGRVTYKPDPGVQAIVDGWPRRFVSRRAAGLGLGPDADLDALILDYLHNKDD
ncbi:NAD-dependent epimerase/dehydratase family protein [uncultured Roseibium sp.]|uniref:NAD-dependent epimerase/dehydratase family protein n=1 Tax=uncultured Roseibium sp. TaxID=1936171 RepID=UPI00321686B0